MGASSSQPRGVVGEGGGPIHISHAHNWQELNGGATPAQLVHDLLTHHGLPVSPIKRRSAGWHMLALQAEVEEARCVVAVVRDEFLDEVIRGSSQESCGLQPSSWCYSELKWAVDMGKPVVVVVWPNTRPITAELVKQLSPSIQLAFRDCTSLNWADKEDGEVALRFGKRIVETLGGEYQGEVPALTQLHDAGLSHLVDIARGELALFSTEDLANAADEVFEDAGVALSAEDRTKLAAARQAAVDALYHRRRTAAATATIVEERGEFSGTASVRALTRRGPSSEISDESYDSAMSEGPVAGNWAGDGDAILSSYQGSPVASVNGGSRAGSTNTSQRSGLWGADASGLNNLPKLLISRKGSAGGGGGSPRSRSPLGARSSSTGELADLLPARASTASAFASARSTDLESDTILSSASSSLAHRLSERPQRLLHSGQRSPNKRKAAKSPSPASASTSEHSNDSVVLDIAGLGFVPNPNESPDINSPWSDNFPSQDDGLESPFMTPISTPRASHSTETFPFMRPEANDRGTGVGVEETRSPGSGSSPSATQRMFGGIFKSISAHFGGKTTEVGLPVTSPHHSPVHSPPDSRRADAPTPVGLVAVAPRKPPRSPERGDSASASVSAATRVVVSPSLAATREGESSGKHRAQQYATKSMGGRDASRSDGLLSLRNTFGIPPRPPAPNQSSSSSSSSNASFSHTSSRISPQKTHAVAELPGRNSGAASNGLGWPAPPRSGKSQPTQPFFARAGGGTTNASGAEASPMRDVAPPRGDDSVAYSLVRAGNLGLTGSDGQTTQQHEDRKGATIGKTTRRVTGRSMEAVLDGGSGQWLSGPQAGAAEGAEAEVLTVGEQPWMDAGSSGRTDAFAALQSYYSDQPSSIAPVPPASGSGQASGSPTGAGEYFQEGGWGDEVVVEDFEDDEETKGVPLRRMTSTADGTTHDTRVSSPASPSSPFETQTSLPSATETAAAARSESTATGNKRREETNALPGSIDQNDVRGSTPDSPAQSLHLSRALRPESVRPDSAAERSTRQRVFAEMDRSLEGRPVVKALIDAQLGALVEGVCWQLGVSTMEELLAISEVDLAAIGATSRNKERLAKFLAGVRRSSADAEKLIPVDIDGSVASALELYSLSELQEALQQQGVVTLDDLMELSETDVKNLAEMVEGVGGRSPFRKARLDKLVCQCKRQALQQIRPASVQQHTAEDAPLAELVGQLDSKATVEEALHKLQSVVASPTVREQLLQTELVSGLLRVMESKSSNGAVAQTAVSILASVIHYDQASLSQVDLRYGVPVVVDFFSGITKRSSGQSTAPRQHALTCATRLVNELLAGERAADVASSLRSAKAVPAIFSLLERRSSSNNSAEKGIESSMLRVVSQLTRHSGLKEEVLARAGAMVTLAEMVPEPSTVTSGRHTASLSNQGGMSQRDERIQLALGVLGNLVEGPNCPEWCVDEVLNCGVLPRVVAWMGQSNDKDEQEAATRLITNLSAFPSAQDTLLAVGAIPRMTPIMLND